MTDKEIIKALECCSKKECYKCPNYSEGIECGEALLILALDLINRQKAEIEILNNNISSMAVTMHNSAKATRNEAIKWFAERLKDYLRKKPKWNCRREKYDNVGFSYDDVFFGIDKVVKEMVGEEK